MDTAASCPAVCGVPVGSKSLGNVVASAAAAAAAALPGCLLAAAELMAAGTGSCTALQLPAKQRICSVGSAAVRLLDRILSSPECAVTSVVSMLLQ
jgi:hypothetical protein